MRTLALPLCLCVVAGFCADPADDNWPQFRGPGGLGIGSDNISLPTAFGPTKALLWKIGLPLGHGSPCVWGDRIFITGFDSALRKLEVIAVNRRNGQIAWRRTISPTGLEEVHPTSSPATSTPVTDGKRVYVYSGSFGMVAYEWDGKVAWEYPMGVSKSPYGSGSSPVLAGDLLLITRDYPPSPLLFAIRKQNGTLAWKTEIALPDLPGPKTAHSTPVIWNNQIVLNRPGEVSAHSIEDGKRLWSFPTASQGTSTLSAGEHVLYVNAPAMGTDTYNLVSLPPFSEAIGKYDADKDGKLSAAEAPANDLFFMKRGGIPDNVPGAHFSVKSFFRSLDRNQDGFVDETEYNAVGEFMKLAAMSKVPAGILSIRPEGQGALPPSVLQWSDPRGAPEVTTPLEYRGRVYAVNAGGIITCLDSKTGKLIYRGRVNAPGAYYASPVAAGGKILVASVDGVVSVLGAGDKLEILANNDLGEPVYGTPAPLGSALYVRSSAHLWAFHK